MSAAAPATTATKAGELFAAWIKAKADEASAKKRRVTIETQILAITGHRKEGAETKEIEGFKVTTTGKLSTSMDWEKWEIVKASIPAELHPVKLKPELDDKGVKWLQENRPEIYALLPIEVKPAKTSVEVKPVPVDDPI